MVQLAEIQRQAEALSREDREGLLAYLLHGLSGTPLGPDDAEVAQREDEMDSGKVRAIDHDEFLSQVGRSNR